MIIKLVKLKIIKLGTLFKVYSYYNIIILLYGKASLGQIPAL